ncbi:MAG: hypothetical protein M3Q53_01095, partial [Actinomycetota bacterium]|nr:hypothetical protein [Actinomycetota bacterium]
SFSRATRESGAMAGTAARFAAMAETISAALAALGVDARVGEVPGEYCPGEYSISSRGAVKLAGIGQRVITGGAHVGGVIVVRGAGRIRDVLEPVYDALELDWNPATTGSVAAEIGEQDTTLTAADPDPLIEEVITSVRRVLSERFALVAAELDEPTIALATELRSDHAAPG